MAATAPVLVTLRVYVRVLLGATGFGVPVWVMARSAAVETVVWMLAWLLDGLESPRVEVTEAVLVNVPLALGAVMRMLMFGASPTASEATVQVTTADTRVQFQPAPEADRNVNPVGIWSTAVIEVATEGPLLFTLRV